MFFIMVNTHQNWEELRKMVVGGQKMTKKIDFLKNFDFCDFWFFCVFRRARWCWTFSSLWMYYKKLQKVGCGDEKTILRENGFSPTDIKNVFFWPIFSRRLSPPAVPGNSYGRWGESLVLMLSLKAPKNKKVKIFEFLTPPTWPKVQLIAIQRPKSLKDYFLESRFMAACKNSANSNGGVSRTCRGVFILNTYRSTPYLERRADGAPTPVLPETGCTSSGHLGGRRGPLVRSFVSGQAFVLLLMSHFLSFVWCLICLISGSALRGLSEIAVYSHSSINISLVLYWSSQRPVLVLGL